MESSGVKNILKLAFLFLSPSFCILQETTPWSPIVEVPAPTNLQIIERVKELTAEFSETMETISTTTTKQGIQVKSASSNLKLGAKYHSFEEMELFLYNISKTYPKLTHLYSIGKSLEGRDLWVLAVGRNPEDSVPGKQEIKYIGNILGNEPLTREVLLHFISYLVTSYQSNSGIRSLLNKVRLHVLPSLNPDGAEKFHSLNTTMCRGPTTGRKNAADVDLNRSFPDAFKHHISTGPAPERDAVQRWMTEVKFALSINFRSGALVATYPYDNKPKEEKKRQAVSASGNAGSTTADDDVFRHLAFTYANNHDSMFLGRPCNIDGRTADKSFEQGIVNGAAWQIMEGSMQDYNYARHGTFEITVYISCCKYVDPEDTEKVWLDNKRALQLFLAEANRGIRGFVTTEDGAPVPNATIIIVGREKAPFYSSKDGEYAKVLLPGTYILEAKAEGYELEISRFDVTEENPTIQNLTLKSLIVSTQDEPDTTSGDGSTLADEYTETEAAIQTTRNIPKERILLVHSLRENLVVRNSGAREQISTMLVMVLISLRYVLGVT